MRQKLEGRYSRGKTDYTGSVQYITEDYIDDSASYGSATLKNALRRAYDIRALYEYTLPINDRFSITAGAGLGHRVLRDLSSRIDPDDYDRKNRTTYAQINTGVNIALPANFEISPRIAYNRAVKGRQYSYEPDQVETRMKQGGGQGIEVEVPISKKSRTVPKSASLHSIAAGKLKNRTLPLRKSMTHMNWDL